MRGGWGRGESERPTSCEVCRDHRFDRQKKRAAVGWVLDKLGARFAKNRGRIVDELAGLAIDAGVAAAAIGGLVLDVWHD